MAGEFLAFIVVLCYLAPVFRIISMIVQEKELKTREGMKMMGLKDSAYWLSYFCYYLIICAIIGIGLTAICKIFIFKYTNWFILFLYFFLFGLSVFSFSLMIAALFNKARVASITGTMLYFASFLLFSLVSDPTTKEFAKTISSLIPTVAASLGTLSLSRFESGQVGIDFSNAREVADNYVFSNALGFLVLDFFIYGLIGLYLDNVIPSATGVRQPFYFFLTKEYWTGEYSGSEGTNNKIEDQAKEDSCLYPDDHFEAVGKDLKTQEENNECLKIRYLNKYFGDKRSVADFSVNMYKNQIFALLGPNGAGKTTTISMLTGLLPISSGSAYFSGFNVFRQMAKTREKLGVCPQHDVLFDDMTPREHLQMFASFKGRSDTAKIQEDVDEILKDIELKDAENTRASYLSGGERRKLSIGIAFIGNSDMIFLDEPTSGIDIATRKKVWVMLKKYKKEKVIILTTHYMEEAEELGNRIGIMTNGELRCVGSSLFLKNVYGAGHNLIIAKEAMSKEEDALALAAITAFVKRHVPGSLARRNEGTDATFFLPKSEMTNIKPFFTDLDANMKTLRIQSYSMTTNTLEEIFLKVASTDGRSKAEGEGKQEGQALTANMRADSIMKSLPQQPPSELDKYTIANEPDKPWCTVFQIHFFAILIKRLILYIRSLPTLVNEVLVPIILVIFGLALTKVPMYYDGETRWFDQGAYEDLQRVLVNTNNIQGVPADNIISQLNPGLTPIRIPLQAKSDLAAYNEMDSILFNSREDKPYRYGSLYIKTASPETHVYEFVTFVNISSQDAAGAFMGYFAEAFLRVATKNKDLKVTFANSPLPLTFQTKSKETQRKGSLVSNTMVIAFALVPASIISFIVKEREDNLKHQQLISGVSLLAYWLANSIMDIIKSLIPSGVSIGLIFAFDVELPLGWLFMLIFAFSIIPFTYATSFLFNKENVSQVTTLMIHFFVGVVLSPVFSILYLFDNTREAGRGLAWVFRIIPSFSMSHGINQISG